MSVIEANTGSRSGRDEVLVGADVKRKMIQAKLVLVKLTQLNIYVKTDIGNDKSDAPMYWLDQY